MVKYAMKWFGLALLVALAPLAQAENATRVKGYTIHHNALTTELLTPEIARSYGIVRSRNRAMLNVSVLRDVPDTAGVPVRSRVRVTATNLRGQIRTIPMREIREGNAIYYIGDFLVEHGEQIHFQLQVRPDDSQETLTAELSEQFFTR